MAYITREDGERFIIPSYRDVLSAKKEALLKREVVLLSQNYGEYITLQRKNVNQYEVAFSPEPGYLLGESVWSYFKRPQDLIYCEAIPNTFEAILVIVKAGIVYLDGSFPLDSIPDELVIFRTQQNNFEIYIYGDVPISKMPEEGKFAFDTTSVKSFNVLDKPVFPTLPVNKAFQLQLVSTVLKSRGIGMLPIKKILFVVVLLGLLWMAYIYISTHKKELPEVFINVSNPYQTYINALTSPDPAEEIKWFAAFTDRLFTIPGWVPNSIDFNGTSIVVSVRSLGARTNLLTAWANANNVNVAIGATGINLIVNTGFTNRRPPTSYSKLDSVVAALIDSMSYVIPGNNLDVAEPVNKGKYAERQITITFSDISTTTFDLIGRQLRNLPLILTKMSINIGNGRLSGTIVLKALGI
ncbi:MAG: hypothetical protein ACYCQI_09690 [Gammaproteobacteria bacterium]